MITTENLNAAKFYSNMFYFYQHFSVFKN